MPSYFSLTFGYRESSVRPGFVARVYESICRAGFPFAHVHAWGCAPDMSLSEIIDWNQQRLEAGFRLGFKQNVSHDYRQILVSHSAYRECRVFIFAPSRQFVLIVPEADVFTAEGSATPIEAKLEPLRELALSAWESGLFAAIQTCDELGSTPSVERLEEGKPPSAEPFALLDAECTRRQALDAKRFEVAVQANGGVFVRSVQSDAR